MNTLQMKNEYTTFSSKWKHCYPFMVKWDKCVGSCNTLNDLSNEVCVPSKTEGLNIHVFNIITEKMNNKF